MTTIAFRAGVLAADSRTTRGSTICPEPTTKVFKLPDGSLAAIRGAMVQSRALVDWLGDPGHRPEPSVPEAQLTIVKPDGSLIEYEGTISAPVGPNGPFYAWGTGMEAALGALHAGVSAEEAVRIACLVDSNSGGPVQSVRLDSAEEPAGEVTYVGGPIWRGKRLPSSGLVHSTPGSFGTLP